MVGKDARADGKCKSGAREKAEENLELRNSGKGRRKGRKGAQEKAQEMGTGNGHRIWSVIVSHSH